MKMKRLAVLFVIGILFGCPNNAKTVARGDVVDSLKMPVPSNRQYVEIRHQGDLTCYFPDFSRIDLVTGTMPAQTEADVIFVCAGAFTGKLLGKFVHINIAGHHVSDGTFYEGYDCGPNNGVFTWSRRSGWQFFNYSHGNSVGPLKTVARENGMGYCQSLLLFEGKEFAGCFKNEAVNQYRALCELDGRLCIIDSSQRMTFKSFKAGLKEIGVKYAIYCDMGTGWNYSWYRLPDGSVVEIFPTKGRYTTNWITFYK